MANNANGVEALSVVDLHKSFGNVEVVKGVSLEAHRGDVISIVGASGSGKSTLLRCINYLEIPTAGTISVSGETILTETDKLGNLQPQDIRQVERLRTKLGMVFQSFNLWAHMTVLENVIEAPIHVLGVPKVEAIERAEGLLNDVGLIERKDYYPSHISGGQQQRAAIARALAMHPDVLLFDEPTSALDPELVGEVLAVIEKLAAEGRTMLIVTHEIDFARDVSSDVIFLHDGGIEEQGPPGKVFKKQESDRFRQFLARWGR